MTHARRYGDRESHPIPLWNGVFEHFDRIGDALWEFAWLIDRITVERGGVGIVLGGQPIRLDAIVSSLRGSRKETVRRHLKGLQKWGYIRLRRTPYGHVIEVLNSHKFGIWKKHEKRDSLPPEKPIHEPEKPIGGSEKPKTVVSKEDAAVTQQKDAAVSRPPVWDFLGIDGSGCSSQVRELCTRLFQGKNGQTPVEFIGACMDGIEAMEGKIPPALAQRATQLRSETKAKSKSFDPIPLVEGAAWATK